MFGSKRGRRDVKGVVKRRMRRTPRKEKAISVHTLDGQLLAHYEKGYGKIRKKVPQLLIVSQFDPHPLIKLT